MALIDLLPGHRRTDAPPEPEAPQSDPPAPPPPAPESHKGMLEIGGMYPIYWDTADPRSVEIAKRNFRDALISGYAAQSYKQTKSAWGGSSTFGEMTRTFDPEADAIRMSLPYAGG